MGNTFDNAMETIQTNLNEFSENFVTEQEKSILPTEKPVIENKVTDAVNIYILKLEKDKYYIGKTQNPDFRIDDHFNANGSAWTKKYKPMEIVTVIPNCTHFDEDKYTLEYMSEHGMHNVRGGSFCRITLDEHDIATIKKMINGANDKCHYCGFKGHFIKECRKLKKQQAIDDQVKNEVIKNNKVKKINVAKQPKQIKVEKNTCSRCHYGGHTKETCFAKKNLYGKFIYDKK